MVEKSPVKRSHWSGAAFLCSLILGVLADQVTKAFALRYLNMQSDVPFLGKLIRLTLVHNSGATMSFAANRTVYLSVFAILAVIVLLFVGLCTTSTWWAITLGLTASGALGNVIDRVLYQRTFLDGAVVDFLNYGPFVGNVADIILTVAAILIIVGIVTGRRLGIQQLDNLLYASDNGTKTAHDISGDVSDDVKNSTQDNAKSEVA